MTIIVKTNNIIILTMSE